MFRSIRARKTTLPATTLLGKCLTAVKHQADHGVKLSHPTDFLITQWYIAHIEPNIHHVLIKINFEFLFFLIEHLNILVSCQVFTKTV